METGKRLKAWRTLSSASTASNASTSSAPDALASAWSGRLLLHLVEPSSSSSGETKEVFITPGCKISGTVTASSLKAGKSLRVALTGKCATNIMGNVGVGPHAMGRVASGSAVPVTYREIHCFLRTEVVLWTEDQAVVKDEFTFAIDVPRIKQCICPAATYTLPPTCSMRNAAKDAYLMDRSTVEITYAIAVLLERKGFFKRDAK